MRIPKISLKSYLFFIGILALILSVVSVTNAWLYQNKQRTHNIETSNFTFAADVFFLQADNSHTAAAAYKDAATGYYLLNISDPNALNYAGKLNINVRYKGLTKAYMRVYIGDMWIVNNKSILKMDTDFNASALWLDNRIYDNYYYYVGGTGSERGMVYSDTADQEKTFSFVSGIRNMAKISNASLYVEIRAEAVQINRINAFWGITSIPE